MSEEELKPARFEEDQVEPFGPRIPYKWVLITVVAVATLITALTMRSAQEVEALRARILEVHAAQIEPVAQRVLAFRSGLEERIQQAASLEVEDFANPRFRFSGIHNAQVLYLRISAEAAASAESLREAAVNMRADAIGSCFGVAPMSMRGMYLSDAPLQPSWVEEVRSAEDRRRLEALDYSIGRHVERELPLLVTMMQSQLFMLVIERGESRRAHPVDVFLWDLGREELLVRARVVSRGRLLSVRVRSEDSPNITRERRPNDTSGAVDCSIAQQVRAVTGEGVIELENAAPDRSALDAALADAAQAAEAEPQVEAEVEEQEQADTEASNDPGSD